MTWLVIGVGNKMRRDDGAGLVVAQSLYGLPGADVLENQGNLFSLLDIFAVRKDDRIIVVDSVNEPSQPGALVVVEASKASTFDELSSVSSHGFGLGRVLALGQRTKGLPPDLRIIGVCGTDFSHGEGLTADVAAGCGAAVQLIRGLVLEGGT